jgi:hypothetical protein
MRATLKELMSHLGIEGVLAPYQSETHQFYDEEERVTCHAEARMGVDQAQLNVEILLFNEGSDKEKPPVEQVMSMVVKPKFGEKWDVDSLSIKSENMTNKFQGWDYGACAFFIAVVLVLKRGEFPDIDALIDEHLDGEGGRAGRGRRGGGRKNPKFKPPTKTMTMKQGM